MTHCFIKLFEKTFTAIINNRLHNYADSVQLILENQAGFRRGLSTLDHIFHFTLL